MVCLGLTSHRLASYIDAGAYCDRPNDRSTIRFDLWGTDGGFVVCLAISRGLHANCKQITESHGKIKKQIQTQKTIFLYLALMVRKSHAKRNEPQRLCMRPPYFVLACGNIITCAEWVWVILTNLWASRG